MLLFVNACWWWRSSTLVRLDSAALPHSYSVVVGELVNELGGKQQTGEGGTVKFPFPFPFALKFVPAFGFTFALVSSGSKSAKTSSSSLGLFPLLLLPLPLLEYAGALKPKRELFGLATNVEAVLGEYTVVTGEEGAVETEEDAS